MSSDKTDSLRVHFTGKNYTTWEFQFKLFVKGKKLLGQVDGSDPAPKDKEP